MTFRMVLATVAATAVVGVAPLPVDARSDPPETTTPIEHFITVMQENHSFDNYFGTYPGADGLPDDTCMPIDPLAPDLGCVAPYKLSGKAIVDLGHTSTVFEKQYADGAMNGFVAAGATQDLAAGAQTMGYYDADDIPFYWNVADDFVLFDRFFTSAAGGSVRNHFYWIAGAPGNTEKDALRVEGFDDTPTIFDSLQAAGVSWKFYVQNFDRTINFRTPTEGLKANQLIWVPLLNYNRFIDDPELSRHIVPLEEYYDDLANGTLPAVSYIVPSGASEHPPGSIQAGERFMRGLITALQRSTVWSSSAFIWTYDDWGGWYDHVAPPQVDEYGLGFRTPALLVSAYAKQGHIDSTTLEFSSILRFIEENWGIEPLASRDRAANNLLGAFDFESPPREPTFLSRDRDLPPLVTERTTIVYQVYGGAFGAASIMALGSLALAHRGRRRSIDTMMAGP